MRRQARIVTGGESSENLVNKRNRSRVLLAATGAAAAALAFALPQGADAAPLTWDPTLSNSANGGGSGTWDLATSNWFNGSADTMWTDISATGTDTAIFGAQAAPGTVTLGASLSAAGLTFNIAGYTLNGGGNTLTLGASGISDSPLVPGVTTIASNINIVAAQSWTVGPASSLAFSGALSGSSTLTKAGTGMLTLSGNNSGFSGNVTFSAGQLNINNANALGSGTFGIGAGILDNTSGAAITIAGNNSINLNNSFTFIGSNDLNLGTGAANAAASRTIITKGGNLTFGGSITLGTGHNLTKQGGGTLTLLSATNSWDQTVIQGGTLDLGSTGILGSTTLALNIAGGELRMTGNDARTTQATGALSLGIGHAVVTLNAIGTSGLSLTPGSLGNRVQGETALFRGTNLGSTPGNGVANITFTAAPSITNGTSATDIYVSLTGAPSLGTTSAAVIRGALADTSATGNGSGFATYDDPNGTGPVKAGIRPLLASEQDTSGYPAANTTTNVRLNLTGAVSIAGKQTNTLQLDNTSTAAQTVTLTNATLDPRNGLLFSGDHAITLTGSSGTLANTGADAIIMSTNTAGVTLDVPVNDTAGGGNHNVILAGPGNITVSKVLSSSNSGNIWIQGPGTVSITAAGQGVSSGGFLITGGTLKLGGSFSLGTSRPFQVASGATLDLNGISVNNVDYLGDPASQNVGGLITNSSTATATISLIAGSSSGNSKTYTGVISGPINLVMGGTASTAVSTQTLSGNSTYTGTTSVVASTLKLGVTNALPTGTALTVSSTNSTIATTLDLNGNSQTVASLAGVVGSTGDTITNNATGSSTLLINGPASTSYAGLLNDGSSGKTLALVKTANSTGVTTLSNGNSTYSGGTTINGGTLSVTNTSGTSATGTGVVTINNGGILAGTGLVGGTVTANSGGKIDPGVGGVGALGVGSLTLNGGSILDMEIASISSHDQINLGAALNTSGSDIVNLYLPGTTTPFNSAGTYNLIQLGSGGFSGDPNTFFTVGNQQAGTSYSFVNNAGFIQLVITGGAVNSSWAVDADGNWSDSSKWTGGNVPSHALDTANFPTNIPLSGNRIVTLDTNETMTTINFGTVGQAAPFSYTIAPGGGTLHLNGNTGSAVVNDGGGSHTISAPVSLDSTTVFNIVNDTVANVPSMLTISGNIGGAGGLTVGGGSGTLVLTGANTYGGNTTVNSGGTLQIGNGTASGTLGSSVNAIVNGTLAFDRPDNISIGNTITGSGTASNIGSGTTTLTGTSNSGTWGMNVTSGTLQVGNGAAASAGTGPVSIASTGILTVNSTSTITLGALAGSGTLNASGGGIVLLSAAGTYTGAINVSNVSNLRFGASATTGAATINLTGGTLSENNVSTSQSANITVAASTTNTIDTFGSTTMTLTGNMSGSGTLSRTAGTGTLSLGGNNASFTGTFNNSAANLTFTAKAAGSSTAQWNFTSGGTITLSNLGGTINFGSLSGSQTIDNITSSSSARVRVGDYNVAGVYPNTSYSGNLTDSGGGTGGIALAKAGKGSLTLSGQNKFALADGTTFTPTIGNLNVVLIDGTLIGGSSTNGAMSGPFGGTGANVLMGGAGSLNNLQPTLLTGGAFHVDNPIIVSGGADTGTAAAGFVATIGGNTDNNSSITGPITLQNNLMVSQVATTGTNALTLASNLTGTAAGSGYNSSGPITVSLNNTGTQTVTFAGPGAINASGVLANGGGTVAVNVTGGTLTMSGANTYTGNTVVSTGATLNVTGSLAATDNVTTSANSSVNFGAPGSTAAVTQQLASLSIAASSTSSITASLHASTPKTLQVGTLTFGDASSPSTSTLDITNNIVIANGLDTDGEAMITSHQVASSTAGLSLGYKQLTTGPNTFEIRATLLGDSDLDGKVNVADLANLAGNFGKTSGQVWINGDFDYNGNVNVADLADLAGNFGKDLDSAGFGSGGATPAALTANAAAVSGAAVPEPTTLGLVGLGAVGLLAPRRRRPV
jgi:autotransporter-associated beta strand protein